MVEERDFSNRSYFPGTAGNTFDVILRTAERIEAITGVLFALLLAALAVIPSRLDLRFGLLWWGFLLLDWALIAGLTYARKSYGPAKPTVLILAVLRVLAALLPIPLAVALQVLGTLLVVYGFWIEPHTIRVTRQTLRTTRLKPGAALRILHLGDLHVERITAREQQLNRLVSELKPDLILFSGDFINLSYLRDPQAWDAARAVISEWRAPMGVFAVTGSPAVDFPDVVARLVDGTPVRWLQDECVTLTTADGSDTFDLVGISCSHKPFEDGPHLKQILPQPERFTILLHHSPDLAPVAANHGIDMQLSGHTHGGQVQLPLLGPLMTASLYGKQYAVGRVPVGEMTLYVTRGIGMEGAGAPRVRLLCPPEVILWEICGENSR